MYGNVQLLYVFLLLLIYIGFHWVKEQKNCQIDIKLTGHQYAVIML